MKTIAITVLTIAASLLTGCTETKNEAYYKLHLAEASTKVAECRTNPANFDSNSECIDAYKADVKTKEYWAAHTFEEMKAEKEFCKAHIANIGQSRACGVIGEGEQQKGLTSHRYTKPVFVP